MTASVITVIRGERIMDGTSFSCCERGGVGAADDHAAFPASSAGPGAGRSVGTAVGGSSQSRGSLGREPLGAAALVRREILQGVVEPRVREALSCGHQVPGCGLDPVLGN